MGIKRALLEIAVTGMRIASPVRKPGKPPKIFVLRNNDLGDLVVVTPLFKALRQAFPDSQIIAGVSGWSRDILKGNPYLSDVVDCNGPWHNHRSRKSPTEALRYIFASPEVTRLESYKFDVGIDVLGSPFGSMLLLRLGIPVRLGRRGYAGGHTGTTACLQFSPSVPVARDALQFARLLKPDAQLDPDLRPQLFLSQSEIDEARQAWSDIEETSGKGRPRVIVAPGAGTPVKQWPADRFSSLVASIAHESCGCIVGSAPDFEVGAQIVRDATGWSNLCGSVSLRQSMALVSQADLVICHSSFVMHLAAAFNKPAVVILTKVIDRISHAQTWEVKGLHYALYPEGEDAHVSVSSVERQTTLLLQAVVARSA